MRTRTRSGGGAPSPGASKNRTLQVSEGAAIGALVTLILIEMIAFGASDVATAAVFGALHAALLLGLLVVLAALLQHATPDAAPHRLGVDVVVVGELLALCAELLHLLDRRAAL